MAQAKIVRPRGVPVEVLADHIPAMRALALRLVRDVDLADDLVQETLIAASRSVPGDNSPLGRWLGRVLRNQFKMWVRGESRRRRREAAGDPLLDYHMALPDSELEINQSVKLLGRAIDALPDTYRGTVVSHFFDGMSSIEIARREKVPSATVRGRLHRGLAILRTEMQKAHGERQHWAGALIPLLPTQLRRPALVGTGVASKGSQQPWLFPFWLRGILLGNWAALAVAGAALVTLGGLAAAWSSLVSFNVPTAATAAPAQPAEKQVAMTPTLSGLTSLGARGLSPNPATNAIPPRTGGIQACPSLSGLIAAAEDGAEVRVPACVYRESVVIERPIKLMAQPGAEIRGSDVYRGFERFDGMWRSLQTVPRFEVPASDQCRDPIRHPCGWPEQVFWNGEELVQIPEHLKPSEGEFAIDANRYLWLGADPSGHEVEVTVRQQWVQVKSSDVVLAGFVMRHAASTQRVRALELGAGGNVVARDNFLSHTHGTALGFGGAYKHVLDNRIENAGGIGIAAWAGEGGLVVGNEVRRNGNMFPAERWWGAGINVVRNPIAIHGNVIADNFGLGVFLIGADGCRLSENLITGHFQSGVAVYRSRRCLVVGNKLKANGRRGANHDVGITLDHADGIQLASNVVLGEGERLYARID